MSEAGGAHDVPDDRPTDPKAGGITLVQVGDLAKHAGNEAFACRLDVAALRVEVQAVLRPIRREWYERIAAPIIAGALVVLAVVALVSARDARAQASTFSTREATR